MAIIASGCSKSIGAEDIATDMLENINSGQAYTLVHKYTQTNEITRNA